MSESESSQIEMTEALASVEEMLECPVCLLMPREGPIPSCPAGCIHNFCFDCSFQDLYQSYFKDTSSVKLAEGTCRKNLQREHAQHVGWIWAPGMLTHWPRVWLTESGTVASSKTLAAPSRIFWKVLQHTKVFVTTERSPAQHARNKSKWRNSTFMH